MYIIILLNVDAVARRHPSLRRANTGDRQFTRDNNKIIMGIYYYYYYYNGGSDGCQRRNSPCRENPFSRTKAAAVLRVTFIGAKAARPRRGNVSIAHAIASAQNNVYTAAVLSQTTRRRIILL